MTLGSSQVCGGRGSQYVFPDIVALLLVCGWEVNLGMPYLGEGTVVPQVALVGEAVADEAKLALLDVLLDGVQELLLGDL